MRKLFFFLWLFCSCGLCMAEKSVSGAVAAESRGAETVDRAPDLLFRQALDAGKGYGKAASAYGKMILAAPVPSAALYYNMANALSLQGEKIAAASLYSRALQLRPGNSDIRENYNLLLSSLDLPLKDSVFPDILVFLPVFVFGTVGTWGIVLLCFSILFILVLIRGILLPGKGMFWIQGMVFRILLVLLLYLVLVLGIWEYRSSKIKVVCQEGVSLFAGDSPAYASVGELSAGEELFILEERSRWFRGRSGGKEGWLEGMSLSDAHGIVEAYAK